jgi:hypothetical protein
MKEKIKKNQREITVEKQNLFIFCLKILWPAFLKNLEGWRCLKIFGGWGKPPGLRGSVHDAIRIALRLSSWIQDLRTVHKKILSQHQLSDLFLSALLLNRPRSRLFVLLSISVSYSPLKLFFTNVWGPRSSLRKKH